MVEELRWDFLEYHVAGRSQYVKNRALRQFMKPILNLQGEERILDVGCGVGAFGKLIQPFLGPRTELIGIDLDPVQVAYGNQHWANMPNMRLEVGDAYQIAYPDASFDIVASMGLLEFMLNHERILREMARVLKRPGKLIVVQIDAAHYVTLPKEPQFEYFWDSYLKGMRWLGIDLELAKFRTFCPRMNWVLEEFAYNIEYRTQITEKFLKMVEEARELRSKNELYIQEVFEFNFQFVKHAGWTESQLMDFVRHQHAPETLLKFLQKHLGEDYYQKTPFRVFRVHV